MERTYEGRMVCKKPTGLSVDFAYLKPGKTKKDKRGEDVFIGEEELMRSLDKADLVVISSKTHRPMPSLRLQEDVARSDGDRRGESVLAISRSACASIDSDGDNDEGTGWGSEELTWDSEILFGLDDDGLPGLRYHLTQSPEDSLRVFLCDKVRHRHNGPLMSYFEIWHKAWRNGTLLPKMARRTNIRARVPAKESLNAEVCEEGAEKPSEVPTDDISRQIKRARASET
ncbi:uncharacterized protein PITG_00737 [Phytophthora infestans T30-4]|uniref:Uncharacterized protein n=1 Tax=Phytophthora infestans (strain T30-4) TaxID=403677 RepID=D0MRK4_PHYIT|nr:uncharacterized protein PITG_00737 [Phytophthora infestans T30-4]EEY58123.1 conserved hypothetical protein [Phytophthora infestans T30-4]|eukprot:XP_002909309.1 conserved hypothetical protein [Phytophthora infestans T30-4]